MLSHIALLFERGRLLLKCPLEINPVWLEFSPILLEVLSDCQGSRLGIENPEGMVPKAEIEALVNRGTGGSGRMTG